MKGYLNGTNLRGALTSKVNFVTEILKNPQKYGFLLKMMTFVVNNDELCIKYDELCIENDGTLSKALVAKAVGVVFAVGGIGLHLFLYKIDDRFSMMEFLLKNDGLSTQADCVSERRGRWCTPARYFYFRIVFIIKNDGFFI